jgi:hypothetical protein
MVTLVDELVGLARARLEFANIEYCNTRIAILHFIFLFFRKQPPVAATTEKKCLVGVRAGAEAAANAR